MAIVPSEPSELRLYSGVPFDPRYEHSIYWGFDMLERQNAYFDGLPSRNFTDFRHIRKDGEIMVNIPYDHLVAEAYNYCCAINTHPYKRWYYFITGKRYVSQTVTALQVELDVIQTYQFDWAIPACMVEREHPASDRVGDNLLEEGLELGEMVINTTQDTTELDELAIVCLSSATMKNPMGEDVSGSIINGIYQGLKMYCRSGTALGATVLNAALSSLSTSGRADGVQAMWMYPKYLINADWDSEGSEVMLEVKGVNTAEFIFPGSDKVDGYTPRNQKLLTYPYRYIYAHNNMGAAATFRYELFDDTSEYPSFALGGSCSTDSMVRMYPKYYRGVTDDNESGITMGGFPACSWTQDAYKIWMAQTAASQDVQLAGASLQIASGAANTAMGVFTGNVGGAVNGAVQMGHGFLQVESIFAARTDAQVQPLQAKGTHSGSFNVANKLHNFRLCAMSIRSEQAKRLDQFFDMYGYKVNEVKVPEIMSRPMWNFVKTIGCVVLGGIDAEDRRKIGAIFDKGITLWHAPDTMYRYDLAAGNIATER